MKTKVLLFIVLAILLSCKKAHTARNISVNNVLKENEEFHFYADFSDGRKLRIDTSNSSISVNCVTKPNLQNCQPPKKTIGTFIISSKVDSVFFEVTATQKSNFGISPDSLLNCHTFHISANLKKVGDIHYKNFVISHYYETYWKIITNSKVHSKGNLLFYTFDSNHNILDTIKLNNVDFVYTFI